MTEFKLVYFNVKGLAETSRILFALAQREYVDYRFPLELVDPVNYKFKRDEFDKAKEAGHLDVSMGKLPLLEVKDKKYGKVIIPQSKAIERYLARRFGFMGSNDFEAARIDAVCECVRDIKDRYQKVRSGTDEERCEYFTRGFKEELTNLIKVLDQGEGVTFAVGGSLSLADVTIYCLVTQFFDNRTVLDTAGHLERIRDIVMSVASRPEVAVWMQKRPKTNF